MIPVIYSEDFLQHKTGRLHPESPQRLTAIVNALQSVSWAEEIEWHNPTQREVIPWIQKLHSKKYLQKVEDIATSGGGMLDADTVISPGSYDVALLAVSAWLDGVDTVIANHRPGFVLARPPGHHAEAETGMGFCLFSNAAIAAYYALEQPNINRVAILDWDVHHGNGTQSLLEANQNLAYCSLHQSPCYPGTGFPHEVGHHHNILNIPLSSGSTLTEYQSAFAEKVMPFLNNFQPDLLIISAGYDANKNDPLASLCLQPSDYGVLTQYCLQVTPAIVFGLEGGYDLTALSQSVVATLQSCLFD